MVTVITTLMAAPAMALEYHIDAPNEAMYAPETSVDEVIVVGASSESGNIDRSKNTALVPPPFGSPESYQAGTGTALNATALSGTTGTGSYGTSSGTIYYPPTGTGSYETPTSVTKFTLPDGLYYTDGSIGTLRIPVLGLKVKVYEGESLANMKKGAGHFTSTSCWDGNVAMASHNRGSSAYFGEIHTLEKGDRITYETKLGNCTYEVFYVGKIQEDDFSRLGLSSENLITLITCVRNQPELRWCVQAREIS